MLKGILLGFSCFLAFLTVHVIVFHNTILKYRFRMILFIWLFFLIVYIVLYFLIKRDVLVLRPNTSYSNSPFLISLSKFLNFSAGFMFYVFLWFGYCQFYFIVDRSVSARIMIEIENSPDKKLNFEQIKTAYNMEDKIAREIDDITGSKFVIEEDGYYKNLTKGRLYVSMLKFLKNYLNLGRGG